MSLVQQVILEKCGRFLVGMALTAIAAFIGIWHGKRLKAQGFTGENYYQKNQLDWRAFLRLTLIVLVGVIFWVNETLTPLFKWFGPYAHQFGMVIMRSLLVFLFAFQWVIWEDRTRLKRSIPFLCLAVLIIIGVELFVLFPSGLVVGRQIAKDGTVLQSTPTTCGPTAMANILRLYGQPGFERGVALAMGTGMNGTDDWEAAKGARKLGFPEAIPWKPTMEEIASDNLPLLLSIDSCGVQHEVALVGLSSRVAIVIDPHVGVVHYPLASFTTEVWKKHCVRLGIPTFTCTESVRLDTFDIERFRRLSFLIEGNVSAD